MSPPRELMEDVYLLPRSRDLQVNRIDNQTCCLFVYKFIHKCGMENMFVVVVVLGVHWIATFLTMKISKPAFSF